MPRTPTYRYAPFEDDANYLEQFVARQRTVKTNEKCCPKCQRGPVPGQFECGRPGSCPNTACPHRSRIIR